MELARRKRCLWDMCAHAEFGVDWREAAAYAGLLQADRSLIAWEWLRRDPAYRAAAARALSAGTPRGFPGVDPKSFGLVAFEPPSMAVPFARPMWRSEDHPYVLRLERVTGRGADDEFDVERMGDLARLETTAHSEHVLLCDGFRTIRLDGAPGTFTCGPARLRISIEGIASARVALLTARRFLAVASTGSFSNSLHPNEPRARRWILKLRAFDAVSAGASLRQIAAELVRASAAEPLWREREPSIRSQAQRLARGGCCLAAGEYRRLLN